MEKRKLTKIITISTVITSIVTVIGLGTRYLILLYLVYKFNIEAGISDSIGIIGGTDSPTVIFYGSQPDTILITIITIVFGLLSIGGIIYLILNRRVVK